MRARLSILAAVAALACACGGGGDDAPVEDPPLPAVIAPSAALAARLHAALVAKGPAYRPRTRHLTPDGAPRYTNRLILETSPYLLQHAHNPVNWYAWGDEPFARARREHKLVLLSIGYSTCHWCHVMEQESFEDEDVARYLNAGFVCIKVDREERPDVDAVYLRAVEAMTGSGGWPMTVVTDADRRPVFGATFLRKDDLRAVLEQLRTIARTDPDRLDAAARELVAAMARTAAAGPRGAPGAEAIERGVRALATSFDPDWGGFGRGTKFPSPPELELLLRYQRRAGDPAALAMVTATLDHLAAGGIHDQLGGGFHRYSTDRRWFVPHFEKTLYDNAQLAIVYLEAAQATGRDDLRGLAAETLDYVLRDLRSPDGAFDAATDADSAAPGGGAVEGYYFTWTRDELAAVIGADAATLAVAWFGLDGQADVGARSVLRAPRSLAEVAAALALPPEIVRGRVAVIRAQLAAARTRRTPPARDDKIVASWNGLAISALARAGLALDRPAYTDAAERAASFALAHLRTADGGLRRSWRDGRAGPAGTLDDYAFLIQGLLDLFEARSDPRWLDAAVALAGELDRRFADPDAGGWYQTDAGAEPLLIRTKPVDDGAEPSGNAVAVEDLVRLEELTGDRRWRDRAEAALAAFAAPLAADHGVPALRAALDADLDTSLEIVIVAPHDRAEAAPLVAEVRRAYVPDRALVVTTEGAALDRLAAALPMVAGKAALGGRATAFVCERLRCRQPTSDPAVLADQLRRARPLYPDRSPAALAVPR